MILPEEFIKRKDSLFLVEWAGDILVFRKKKK